MKNGAAGTSVSGALRLRETDALDVKVRNLTALHPEVIVRSQAVPAIAQLALGRFFVIVHAMVHGLDGAQITEYHFEFAVRHIAIYTPRHGQPQRASPYMACAHRLDEQIFVVIRDAAGIGGINNGFFPHPYLAADPLLDNLRAEPQFANLMRTASQRHEAFKHNFFWARKENRPVGFPDPDWDFVLVAAAGCLFFPLALQW
jgi:hypothetical protein